MNIDFHWAVDEDMKERNRSSTCRGAFGESGEPLSLMCCLKIAFMLDTFSPAKKIVVN